MQSEATHREKVKCWQLSENLIDYQWAGAEWSLRAEANADLLKQIEQVYREHKGRYGSPRITQQLRQKGVRCGKNRVARLMRENELAARRKKAFRPRTTLAGERVAPNLIKDLEPSAPDQVWVSDITYISTLEGWLYLAVILDLFSHKVVGWKLGETLEAQLVVRALRNALILRQPNPGLYFHSDRGSQYSSEPVKKPLAVIKASLSMSGRGNCYENPKAEAFFSTLKTECFPSNQVFATKAEARRELESPSRGGFVAERSGNPARKGQSVGRRKQYTADGDLVARGQECGISPVVQSPRGG